MKKSFLRVTSVFLTIITVALLFYGCNKSKSIPNEGIDTVTDKDGVTYLAVTDSEGNTLAGFTNENGEIVAAEIDDNGNVLFDGTTCPVSYDGEMPTNDTTAVDIDVSKTDDFDYNQSVASTSPSSTNPSSTTTTKPSNPTEPAEEYLSEKYKKLFQSETYYIEFTTDDETAPYPITLAVKNGNIYMKTKFEGMNCCMIYQKKKDNVYIVLTDYHVYCKMPSDTMDDLSLDLSNEAEIVDKDISEVTIGNRECRCESYSFKDGSTSSFYFYNNELVRLDQITDKGEASIMNVTKISSSVDDSLFELPKGFVPIDLSKLDLGD